MPTRASLSDAGRDSRPARETGAHLPPSGRQPGSLAARALGALDALGQPQAEHGHADAQTAVPPDLATALYAPACATYLEEGRAGGISLIITLYPR